MCIIGQASRVAFRLKVMRADAWARLLCAGQTKKKSKKRAMSAPGKLYVGASAFSLPSVMPESIAAECALRFSHVRFEAVCDLSGLPATPVVAAAVGERAKALRLADGCMFPEPVFSSPSGACVAGTEPIIGALAFLGSAGRLVGLTSGLSNAQLAANAAVTSLCRATVFPAFEFLAYAHDANFTQLLPALQRRQSLTSRLLNPVPAQRRAKLARLFEQYGLASEADAIELMTSGLVALERYLSAAGVSVESSAAHDDAVTFFHGGASPTVVDCYVFAAASAALFSRCAATSALSRLQGDEAGGGKRRFPLLAHYVGAVSLRYFERYAGLHFLNIPPPASVEVEPDVYRPGRSLVLAGTAVFAALYFLVANAATVVELLQEEGEAEEHGELAEQGQVAIGGDAAQQQQQQPAASGSDEK
jgi:hypothetical protein